MPTGGRNTNQRANTHTHTHTYIYIYMGHPPTFGHLHVIFLYKTPVKMIFFQKKMRTFFAFFFGGCRGLEDTSTTCPC